MSETNRSSNNNIPDDSSLHSPSSSNHSIISIQSIHSINPISRIPQTITSNINTSHFPQVNNQNQYNLYTQLQHRANQMQPPSISTNITNPFSHQNQSIFNNNNHNTHCSQLQPPPPPSHQDINFNHNNIQNPPVPIPTNTILPPMPLPFPSLQQQQQNNRNIVTSPIKHTNSHSNIHSYSNKKRKRCKTKRSRHRKRNKNESEDIYYYQLERACGLEIQQIKDSQGSERPPARFGHCCCIHDDSLYVWGGRSQTHTFHPVDNELWRYHLCSQRWKKIKPKLNPYYKSTETYHGSNPQPRCKPFAVVGATAIIHQNCIYAFGGYHSRYTNALLKYDIYNNYWCVVDARGMFFSSFFFVLFYAKLRRLCLIFGLCAFCALQCKQTITLITLYTVILKTN